MPLENSQGSFDAFGADFGAVTRTFVIDKPNVRSRSEECFLLILRITKQDRKTAFVYVLKVSYRAMLCVMSGVMQAT